MQQSLKELQRKNQIRLNAYPARMAVITEITPREYYQDSKNVKG
jgi:hypothetical protein